MKDKILKTGIVLTLFLLMGTVLHLSYEDKIRFADAGSKNSQLAASASYLNNIDYGKASKGSGIPVDQLKSMVPKLVSGAGSCISVASISVNHASCMPAGPGPCTGSDENGREQHHKRIQRFV